MKSSRPTRQKVEHLWRAVVAIGTDQDLDPGPVAADLAHQPAQKGAGLGTTGPARWAQHGGHRPALTVKDDDGLEAVLVVVGVEEPQLLPTVDGVEGVIHVQGYTARHLPEAAAVQPDHGAGHPQQDPRSRQVLKARDGWL
jgi:hypothetical protein